MYNISASVSILMTYPVVLYWTDQSIAARLSALMRSKEMWISSEKERFEEARMVARSLVPVSGSLAGISLATIALATRFGLVDDTRVVVGVGMMVLSSILFFWSLGMNFTANVPTRTS